MDPGHAWVLADLSGHYELKEWAKIAIAAYLAHVGGAVTGIFVAFLFYDEASYVKQRNAAAEGWSVYEGPE